MLNVIRDHDATLAMTALFLFLLGSVIACLRWHYGRQARECNDRRNPVREGGTNSDFTV